mgnify:CR=1 FL=1
MADSPQFFFFGSNYEFFNIINIILSTPYLNTEKARDPSSMSKRTSIKPAVGMFCYVRHAFVSTLQWYLALVLGTDSERLTLKDTLIMDRE